MPATVMKGEAGRAATSAVDTETLILGGKQFFVVSLKLIDVQEEEVLQWKVEPRFVWNS